MKVGYLVSRFPTVTETFVMRELNGLSAEGIEIELCALFPAPGGIVHESAREWVTRVHRPGALEAFTSLGWWLRRRPRPLLGAVGEVIRWYGRRPDIAIRALATIPIAAAHARRLQRAGVDHVHAHWATYPALAAWLCRRLTGLPYSFTVHSHDLFLHQLHLAEKTREAHFVVTVSRFNHNFLRELVHSQTPLHVVRCGIDVETFRFRERRLPETGEVRALCVASLLEVKGHRVLFEAIAGDGEVGRITLDLVGEGPLRERLEGLADELGVDGRVRFHGALAEDDVRTLLDDADLFVLASHVSRQGQPEGLPVALIEALASGVPVVATRLSGIPEVIEDGVTGVLTEPGDVAGLREALERVLRDPESGWERAAAGRWLVESEFDARASAQTLRRLFEDGESNAPRIMAPA